MNPGREGGGARGRVGRAGQWPQEALECRGTGAYLSCLSELGERQKKKLTICCLSTFLVINDY